MVRRWDYGEGLRVLGLCSKNCSEIHLQGWPSLTAFSRAPFEGLVSLLLTRLHIFLRWCCSVFFEPDEDSIYPENFMASRVLYG